MISRLDETELLTPLHGGMYQEPRWHTFLERLRGRTGADYAALIFRQGDAPMHEATELFSGRDVRTAARTTPGDLYRFDPTPYNELRPGRVYRADELLDPGNPHHKRFQHEYLEKIGLRFGRLVRVTEPGGASVWLIINRMKQDFAAAESSLLSAIAPHAAIALRTFAELERERQRAAIGGSALLRSGLGWIALDGQARLVDADQTALRMLRQATGLSQKKGARLSLASAEASGLLADACVAFQTDAGAASQLIRLSIVPRLDLFAMPAHHRPLVALTLPTLIGFLREDRSIPEKRLAMLSSAYNLSPSEAHLALALCRGRSIREAAAELGLTFETARNYSKKVYAKTGTRGQADLVREILTSVVALE